MNSYDQKQADKKQYYLDQAAKCDADAEAAFDSARQATAGIPMGQPILVGHHSEGRHRRDLGRHDSRMRKGIELQEKAAYYRGKAAGMGKGGISADDPAATEKLQAKIDSAKRLQAFMKQANKIIRRKLDDDGKVAALVAECTISESKARELLVPDFCNRVGFPAYQLSNNNANIKRMEGRVDELRKAPKARQEFFYPESDVQVVVDPAINRTQVVFPGKPPEAVRTVLKANGFRWAPSQGAWQRHCSERAFQLADMIAKQYEPNGQA